MITILDACSLIALLSMETGAPVVRQTFRENPGECFAHATNLCEVYYHVVRVRDVATAERALSILVAAGVIVREDLDEAFWQDAGQLKAIHRHVSLADCYCIALARRLNGEVLTSDHHEFDPLLPHGICPIRFIR